MEKLVKSNKSPDFIYLESTKVDFLVLAKLSDEYIGAL